MPSVGFGVHTGPQDIELDELRRLWRWAESKGFEWLSVWDHFYEAPPRDGNAPTFEAIACMAAMAVETTRVRIGCLVFCMGYRNPALLAKSLTTIDHLSHGRVTVGLGAGWHLPEHEGYGYTFPSTKERLDRLVDGTRLIRRMLTSGRSTYHGRFYNAENAANYPQPVQERVPIIIGGGGEQRTLRIAARRADGWNVPYIPADTFKHKSKVLDQWCERYDRDPKSIERSVNLHFLMTSKGPPDLSHQRPNAMEGGLHGKPQEVIDRIGEYIDGGAARVNIATRPPLDWEALQSFVEDVMPAFK